MITILEHLNKLSKAFIVLLGVLLVVLFGITDYLAGYEISFEIFHLLPIAIVSWFVSRLYGAIISVLGIITWSLADLASGHLYSHITIPIWNSIMNLGVLLVINFFLSTIKKSLEEKKKSVLEWQTTFNAVGDAICMLDVKGKILQCNEAITKLLGKPYSEIIGHNCWELICGASKPIDGCPMVRMWETHRSETMDLSLNNRWFNTTANPVMDKAGNLVGSVHVITDITESRQHKREMETIVTISSALRKAESRNEMLPVILDHLLYLMKIDGVAFAMRDPVRGETLIELAKGSCANWTGLRLQPGEGVSGHVIATGQPYLNNDARSDPLISRLDLLGDIRAVACVPLIAQSQTIGALLIGSKTDIDNDDIRLFPSISDIAANALQRAALHEQTQSRLQQLVALRTIDMAISSSLNLQVTLNVLIEHVIVQLRVDAATVLLLNPHTQMLEYAISRGFRSRAIQQTRLRVGEGHAGRAVRERCIVSIPNVLKTEDACVRAQMLAGEVFISHYAVPLIAKGQVKGVLEVFHRIPLIPDQEWLDFLETLAIQAAIAIDNASLFDDLQRSNVELILAYDTTLEGWSNALDMRDKETEGHSQRAADMTLKIARAMGVSEAELLHVRRGALLHDIGKMGIPDNILLKPGKLTDEEWEIMRKHPVYAYEMLSPIAFLRPAIDIPYCHHERWDGTGYPRGLKGEHIPLPARIFAVVDVWDALKSARPYRPAWAEEEVKKYIQDQTGKHFDPKVVEVFLSVIVESEKLKDVS